jgi:hypothetical protein
LCQKAKEISLDEGDSQGKERQIDCDGVAKGYPSTRSSVELFDFDKFDEY